MSAQSYHVTQKKYLLPKSRVKEHFESFIRSLPGSIYCKDAYGKYLACSDYLIQEANLLSTNSVIGKTDYDIFPKIQADTLRKNDEKVMRQNIFVITEEIVTLPSGEQKFYEVVKAPWKDEQGNIIGIIGNSIDITQRKQALQALKQAKERVEAASKAKTEFIENMRHDIRTPLAGIVGFAELIKSEVENPQRVEEYLDNLIASSYALTDFLNSVLESIQASSGQMPITAKKFSLRSLVDSVIDLHRPQALAKQLALTINYDATIPKYLLGDKKRIQRIILELVTNALKFTDRGEVVVEIKLVKQENHQCIIKFIVQDTGIGMPEDKIDTIFTRFTRLAPSYEGNYSGAGLGLFVIKGLIEELNGEIYVKSNLNKGSTFSCVLPLKIPLLDDDSDVEAIVQQPLHQTSPFRVTTNCTETTCSENKIRVLVVEDNPIAARVVLSMLEQFNCQVDHAKDGKTACEKVINQQYDLIFMDIGLPDLDGYQVTQYIRKHECKSIISTPIVALTGHVEEAIEKQRYIAVGMSAVLTKPLKQEQAHDMLATLVPSYVSKQEVSTSSK
jgi:two-component system aerobic respiration control sensor histidine kinase ArcB